MFKNFQGISSKSPVKNSVTRGIKLSLKEQYPKFEEETINLIFGGQKQPIFLIKCKEQIQLLMTVEKEIVFFCKRNGPWLPTLRIAHKYSTYFDHIQVDSGAIKHVLSGSDIMDRGITSKGGNIPTELDIDAPVLVMAQDKQTASAVGILLKSTENIRQINNGKGIRNMHHIGDPFWHFCKSQ